MGQRRSISCSIVEQVSDDGARWIQVARTGSWQGHPSGPFELTAEHFASMVREFDSYPEDLPLDFNHSSLEAGEHPAAGWIKELAVRGDGLWARVEYVGDTAEQIAAKRYRYISPVPMLDVPDRETGETLSAALHSVAITNVPFISGMQALAAARAAVQQGATPPQETTTVTEEESAMVEALAAQLGLDPAALMAAIEAVQSGDAPEEGDEGGGEAAMMAANRALSSKVGALEARLAEVEADRAKALDEAAQSAAAQAIEQHRFPEDAREDLVALHRSSPERFQRLILNGPAKSIPLARETAPRGAAKSRGDELTPARAVALSRELDGAERGTYQALKGAGFSAVAAMSKVLAARAGGN